VHEVKDITAVQKHAMLLHCFYRLMPPNRTLLCNCLVGFGFYRFGTGVLIGTFGSRVFVWGGFFGY
jgi:hypothetical protein